MVNKNRVYEPANKEKTPGKVIYWMSRDQRSADNWGLLYASNLAKNYNTELAVVFCLAENFLGATERQYEFMFEGLKEVEKDLEDKNIPFYLLSGDPTGELKRFISDHEVKHLVTDFDPLNIKQEWQKKIYREGNFAFYEVDSHNIVPARIVSNKREFGAYTLRPKIHKKLEEFLDDFPMLEKQEKLNTFNIQKTDWDKAFSSLKIDKNIKAVDWIKPGQEAAMTAMENFFGEKLSDYNEGRNDPNKKVLSNLSPYLHFGHISAQRVALELLKKGDKNANIDSFLEELIVRKELSDNYCLNNPEYETLKNIPEWAKKTLEEHKKDEREYVYSLEEFEKAKTHEDLWNAAQNEMVKSGKMHGYMRMYWAKKILEWSESPEEAMKIAVYLNDKYELDGRDPNGYVGCAWAIAGVHDRAWTERPVYGKIRYMNYNGAKRKFDVKSYIQKWNS
ncbi:MAG: deoxyribodipyrimidine photo-lyase [Bacteroidales bacterium]